MSRLANPAGAEMRAILVIALPLTAAYLAEFAMFITTKVIVGHLGYVELAAVGITGNLTFEILVVLMGLLSIIGVFAARAEGAGARRNAGTAVRQGFLVATVIGAPAMVLVWNLDIILANSGQDPRVVELSKGYLRGLSGCILPVLWFAVLRNFVAALARTHSVMLITVAAVALNYGLSLLFVHGAGSFPALGLFGAGLATTVVSWAMFIALVVHIYYSPSLRGYGVFTGRLRIDIAVCANIFKLGLPIAGLVLLEAGLFIAVSILSGVFGAEELAAYELLIAWIGIPFVIALGLAEGTMVRVAHNAGQNNPVAARTAGIVGMASGMGALGLLTAIPLGIPDVIVTVFLKPEDPGFDTVTGLAKQLLVIAAIFQVFDGLQAVASRALRGLQDTFIPLWIAAFGYWVLGIGGGVVMAFPLGLKTHGLWWGLALGITVAAFLLALRFLRLSARPLPHG